MSKLFVILAILVVVVLTVYGSIKLFHEVRTKWLNWLAERDRKAAQASAQADVLAELPRRFAELSRLHNDLKDSMAYHKGRIDTQDRRLERYREHVNTARSELADIRKALKGYI